MEKRRCNNGHTVKNQCKAKLKKEQEKICAEKCFCKYICGCGWHPKANIDKDTMKKQYKKHLTRSLMHIIFPNN